MGSSRRRVGRLRGVTCSNNDGGNVVTLMAARLDGGLQEESMRVCARGGGRWTTQQEGVVDDAGQAARRGTTRQEGWCTQRKTSRWWTTGQKDGGRGHNTRRQWRPRYSAATLRCMGGGISAAGRCCIGGAMGDMVAILCCGDELNAAWHQRVIWIPQ